MSLDEDPLAAPGQYAKRQASKKAKMAVTEPYELISEEAVTKCYVNEKAMIEAESFVQKATFKDPEGKVCTIMSTPKSFMKILRREDVQLVARMVGLQHCFNLASIRVDPQRCHEMMTSMQEDGVAHISDLDNNKIKVRITPDIVREALALDCGRYEVAHSKTTPVMRDITFLATDRAKTFADILNESIILPMQIYHQLFTITKPQRYTQPEVVVTCYMDLAMKQRNPLKSNLNERICNDIRRAGKTQTVKKTAYIGAGQMLTRVAYQALGIIDKLKPMEEDSQLMKTLARQMRHQIASASRALEEQEASGEDEEEDEEEAIPIRTRSSKSVESEASTRIRTKRPEYTEVEKKRVEEAMQAPVAPRHKKVTILPPQRQQHEDQQESLNRMTNLGKKIAKQHAARQEERDEAHASMFDEHMEEELRAREDRRPLVQPERVSPLPSPSMLFTEELAQSFDEQVQPEPQPSPQTLLEREYMRMERELKATEDKVDELEQEVPLPFQEEDLIPQAQDEELEVVQPQQQEEIVQESMVTDEQAHAQQEEQGTPEVHMQIEVPAPIVQEQELNAEEQRAAVTLEAIAHKERAEGSRSSIQGSQVTAWEEEMIRQIRGMAENARDKERLEAENKGLKLEIRGKDEDFQTAMATHNILYEELQEVLAQNQILRAQVEESEKAKTSLEARVHRQDLQVQGLTKVHQVAMEKNRYVQQQLDDLLMQPFVVQSMASAVTPSTEPEQSVLKSEVEALKKELEELKR